MNVRNSIKVSSKNRFSLLQFWVEKQNQSRLYPILLQEDLHAITFQNLGIYHDGYRSFSDDQINFVKIKRIIRNIRYGKDKNNIILSGEQHDNIPFFIRDVCVSVSDHFILEPIAWVLLGMYEKDPYVMKSGYKYPQWDCYNSIHSSLSFLEKKLQYSTFLLETSMMPAFHAEILIRILRKKITDASFLHIIRELLYNGCLSLEKPALLINKGISFHLGSFLWNIYAIELDNFFFLERKNLGVEKASIHDISIDNLSCRFKLTDLYCSFLVLFSQIPKDFYQSKNIPIFYQAYKNNFFYNNSVLQAFHYIRFANTFLLSTQHTRSLCKVIQERYFRFFERRLGSSYEDSRIQILSLNNTYFFLGYVLQIKIIEVQLQIMTRFSLRKSKFSFSEVYMFLPLSLVIRVLANAGLCNLTGYPISKSNFSILDDTDIVQRFRYIRNNFLDYYSGCRNRKALSYVEYILRYACAKTLACKHKTTLRFIWKKYGSHIGVKSSVTQKKIYFKPVLRNRYSSSFYYRVWNLSLKFPDPLIFALEDIVQTNTFINI
uniref:Maturase K n=2 Tax=Roya TaxID=43942 RepID=A0A191T6H3_9VIRI|nr:putative maturase [Roya anglica]YP_009256915.1 maturase K [Roya obtusa]AHZ11136.1 putative maturase [Roya anglica]ANI25995.1 maturase K [Roya obtusa]